VSVDHVHALDAMGDDGYVDLSNLDQEHENENHHHNRRLDQMRYDNDNDNDNDEEEEYKEDDSDRLVQSKDGADLESQVLAEEDAYLKGQGRARGRFIRRLFRRRRRLSFRVSKKIKLHNPFKKVFNVVKRTGRALKAWSSVKRSRTSPWWYKRYGTWRKYKLTSTTRKWVNHCRKWYQNDRSNMVWKNAKWVLEDVAPHSTNPNLEMKACKWVLKPQTMRDGQWTLRSSRWWKSPSSNMYYGNGQWHVDSRVHCCDPRKQYVAGNWVNRAQSGAQKLWTHRFGKWWETSTSYRYFKQGKWVLEPTSVHASNPYYYRDAQGRFLLRPVQNGPHHSDLYKYNSVRGVWYKKTNSTEYYWKEHWYQESPFNKDPRYRPRGGYNKICGNPSVSVMQHCQRMKWYQLPVSAWKNAKGQPFIRANGAWWLDGDLREYWAYGAWHTRKLSRAEKAEEDKKIRLERLRAESTPPVFDSTVDHVTNQEFGKFMNWFLNKYVDANKKATTYIPKHNPKLNPEAGPGAFNPEPRFSIKLEEDKSNKGTREPETLSELHPDAPGNTPPQLASPYDETVNSEIVHPSGLLHENPVVVDRDVGKNKQTGPGIN